MNQTCFACRTPISSHQAREGEGRCRSCDADDYYEEDIFIDEVKVDVHWVESDGHMLTFQAMTTWAQSRLAKWLRNSIPDDRYKLSENGEAVLFSDKEDFDLAYLTFV